MSESFYSSDTPVGVSCPLHPHPLPALMGLSPCSISCPTASSGPTAHSTCQPHTPQEPCPMAWRSWEMQGIKPGKGGGDQWGEDLDLMLGHCEMQQKLCGSPKYRFVQGQDSEHRTHSCFCLPLDLSGLCCFACVMQPPNSPTAFHVQNMDQAGSMGRDVQAPAAADLPCQAVPATRCSRLCLGLSAPTGTE